MLDIGWTEIMLIAGVAVLVISPKDLPRAMRTVGNWVGQMRRMATGFRRQLDDAIRETELDEVRKGVEDIKSIDPLGSARKSLTDLDTDLRKEMDSTGKALKDATKVTGSGMATSAAVESSGEAAAEAVPAVEDGSKTA